MLNIEGFFSHYRMIMAVNMVVSLVVVVFFIVVFVIAHCHNVHNIAPHGATAAEQSDSALKEACFQGFGPPSRNSNSVIFGSIHNQSINQ